MRIETLLEEIIQPKLQEIADAVCRLEEANTAPEGTPAGRELARRAEVANCAATNAHTDALKAAAQAQVALDTAKGILDVWKDIRGMVSVAAKVVMVIAGVLAIIVAAHTLGWIR